MRLLPLMMLAVFFTGCHAGDAPVANRSGGPGPVIIKGDGPKTEKLPLPKQSDDYISFEGGIKVYPALRRVELAAKLLGGQRRPLEFLVVGPGGSAHEALFTTIARAEYVKRGLEIIGLKEGKEKAQGRGYSEDPQGEVVRLSVRFKHRETGADTVARIEDWLWDAILKRSPPHGIFVFTGGLEQYMPDLNRSVIAADELGNMISVWHDASCIIDNGHKNGAISDVYSPNPEAPGMPLAGSDVTLIFEPEKS